jgi:cell wall-associated NlpC family hydrolase
VDADPRLNAYRDDLADERLRGIVAAPRYVAGRPARTVAGLARVRRAPDRQSETVSFYHYGEEILVFDEADGVAWCQSREDAYVGYVDVAQIAGGAAPAPSHFVATLGSYAYAAPDLRLPPREFLPRHSGVSVIASGLTTRGTQYARLDTGLFLPFACLAAAPPRSPDIAAASALYIGCPYLWGGRSFFGIDCSGLVQSAFRDTGVAVPRDTDLQQEAIGMAVAIAKLGELRRNDLLYRPGHVLICEGRGTVVHADGATMTVRRDSLAELMQTRGWTWVSFTVRRLDANGATT